MSENQPSNEELTFTAGVALGGLILGEPITLKILLALIFIVSGILVLHWKTRENPPAYPIRRRCPDQRSSPFPLGLRLAGSNLRLLNDSPRPLKRYRVERPAPIFSASPILTT